MSAGGQAKPTVSLHRRIIADIEGDILSGARRPGERIPFEHELTERYGCSRMTVNKALTQLAAAGLIERRRKVGSFVRQPQSQSAVLRIPDIGAEVRALGIAYSFTIVARRTRRVRPSDRAIQDYEASGWLLEIVCRHDAGPRAFCLEERLISLEAVPAAADESFATLPPGTWLLTKVPWTNAEHRIRAMAADALVAQRCRVAVGSPCLAVERRTWRAEEPVTFVRLVYPGEGHELVASFAPGPG